MLYCIIFKYARLDCTLSHIGAPLGFDLPGFAYVPHSGHLGACPLSKQFPMGP